MPNSNSINLTILQAICLKKCNFSTAVSELLVIALILITSLLKLQSLDLCMRKMRFFFIVETQRRKEVILSVNLLKRAEDERS